MSFLPGFMCYATRAKYLLGYMDDLLPACRATYFTVAIGYFFHHRQILVHCIMFLTAHAAIWMPVLRNDLSPSGCYMSSRMFYV